MVPRRDYLAGRALAVFVVGEDHLGVAYFADDQDAGAVDGLVVGLGEGWW
jgi:hypothetical protein